MNEKPTQIFMVIKYQKKVFNVFVWVTLIDSVYRTGKNYYPRVFLEECKYVVQEKKIPQYITDDEDEG